MNLLMTAPLYDNRGTIRYFIGAQVDVSGLIEEGRGLDSFARCLEDRALHRQRDSDRAQESPLKKSLRILNEFGQMLSLDESSSFQPHSRSSSMHSKDNASATNRSARGTTGRRELGAKYPRRVLGNDDKEEEDEQSPWTFASIGPSGKLPGVYQNVSLFAQSPFENLLSSLGDLANLN